MAQAIPLRPHAFQRRYALPVEPWPAGFVMLLGNTTNMDTDSTQSTSARVLNMRQASKLAKISEVTLRKHLKTGHLKGTKVEGTYGKTWEIEYEALSEFVQAQYGRRLSLRHQSTEAAESQGGETLRQLRTQLDATLVELGRYRQIAASTETTAAEVERILKERIAEVQAERDAAKAQSEEVAAELLRLKSRGFWGRVFGGK